MKARWEKRRLRKTAPTTLLCHPTSRCGLKCWTLPATSYAHRRAGFGLGLARSMAASAATKTALLLPKTAGRRRCSGLIRRRGLIWLRGKGKVNDFITEGTEITGQSTEEILPPVLTL